MLQGGASIEVGTCPTCGTQAVRGEILSLTPDGVDRVGSWLICMCTEQMECDACPGAIFSFGWITFTRHLVHEHG